MYSDVVASTTRGPPHWGILVMLQLTSSRCCCMNKLVGRRLRSPSALPLFLTRTSDHKRPAPPTRCAAVAACDKKQAAFNYIIIQETRAFKGTAKIHIVKGTAVFLKVVFSSPFGERPNNAKHLTGCH